MYHKILKPILFRFDPEQVHNTIVVTGRVLGSNPITRKAVRGLFHFSHPSLKQKIHGITFENPIGLSAGFDKNAELTNIIPSIGFGFMEVGAVTHKASLGNTGRHLVRLPEDQSIIVYYGLKNIGAEKVLRRLAKKNFRIPTGVNIAKSNRDDITGEASLQDFVAGYQQLSPRFSYTTLNISCPNVQDGCSFQDPVLLHELLTRIAELPKHGPVFVKIGNDHTESSLDKILETLESFPGLIDGMIISNLAKDRSRLQLRSPEARLNLLPHGGISGRPIASHSTTLIRHVARTTKKRYTLIGVGGVFTAEDAYAKIKAGASLVQIITGLIYGGPSTVKQINQGLVTLLTRDGFSSIQDAVGSEA